MVVEARALQKASSNICIAVICGIRTDVSTLWCALCEKQLQAPLILWWCLEFTQALNIHTLTVYDLSPLYCDDKDNVSMLQKVFFCNEEFQTEEKPSTVKQTVSHKEEKSSQIVGLSRLGDQVRPAKTGLISFLFSQQGGVVSVSPLILFTWAISRSSLCLYLFATHHCVQYYCPLWVTPLGILAECVCK